MALVPPLHIVGVPFNSAGLSSGVARAPTALRRAGLIEKLEAVATALVDRGDVQLAGHPPLATLRLMSSHRALSPR